MLRPHARTATRRAAPVDPLRCTPALRSLVRTIAVLAVVGAVAPGRADAQRPTAATLHAQVAALLDSTAAQWAGMMTPDRRLPEPVPRRPRARARLVRAADARLRAPPGGAAHRRPAPARRRRARVAALRRPVRASAFDMLGAAYAYRTLALSGARRAQLALLPGLATASRSTAAAACCARSCWSNLKLVDALAVLAITGAGIASPDPGGAARRPGRRARGRRARRSTGASPQVVDHGARARISGRAAARHRAVGPAGRPARLPRAVRVHARARRSRSSARARRAPRARARARDAGRAVGAGRARRRRELPRPRPGPGLGARARRRRAGRRRARRRRHPPGPRRALPRRRAARDPAARGAARRRRRASSSCPARARARRTDGIDGYAHTVAYNGLALFGLTAALDALAAIPAAPDRPAAGRPAARRRRRRRASGLGVVVDRPRLARGAPTATRRRTTCATTSARSRSSAAPRPAGSTCSRRGR